MTRRMRIAVLCRHFCATGGGAERYAVALVEHLAALHDIHVFAQQITHQWPGVTYHRVPHPFSRPRWVNQLWFATATWWATRCGFDVVHSHEITWHGQVQTVHVLPVKYKLFDGLAGLARVMRWARVLTSPRLLAYLCLEHLRFASVTRRIMVATSQQLVAQTLSVYPVCRDALRVVLPGIEQVQPVATPAQKSSARQVLGLPAGGHCVLWVGHDYLRKGLDTLIDALPLLPDNTYLALVGAGQPVQLLACKQQAARLGVLQRVYFLGALQDMTAAYTAADCLAHPTREDTFAMVVLEAMAHGLPVVVSCDKFCGIAGLLQHGRDALLLSNPLDADELARALRQLVLDPDRVRSLQQASMAFASAHRWADLAQQQAQIYRDVAAGSAAPPGR